MLYYRHHSVIEVLEHPYPCGPRKKVFAFVREEKVPSADRFLSE